MRVFLFHVINLARRADTPAELLSAVWFLAALLAWLVFGLRTYFLHDHSHENELRVYRHLWDSLEKLYRELGDGDASNATLRSRFREAYTLFLRNARVIEG